MIRPSRIVLALLVTSTLLAACRRQPEVQPMPMPTVNQDSIDEANRRRADSIANAQRIRDSIDAANRRRADSIAAANARMDEERRRRDAARSALTSMVNYDYNRAEIRSDAASILDAKIPVLRDNPAIRIRIAGHADERGSDEYNIALGQRRAAAAKRYLTDRGIADARIDIVSYGEERPLAMGSDESAWAQNRRAEFEITAGDIAVAR